MRLLLWLRLPTLMALWWTRLARGSSRFPRTSSPKSILVVRLDALGDLVLTTPVFRALKRSYPSARLTVVAQSAYASILASNPYIDELLFVRAARNKLLPKILRNLVGVCRLYRTELRSRSFDLAISPRWDTDEHHATLLCLLARAAIRVGYAEKTSAGKRSYNRSFDRAFDICLGPGPLQHEMLRNLAVVAAVGGQVRDDSLDVHLTDEDRRIAQMQLAGSPPGSLRVALGIGAQSPGRRWPLERYAACVRELAKDFRLQVVITCAPSEHEDALSLATMIKSPGVISDAPNIRETCAALEQCDAYLGNDTGAAHLAAAMGCATVVVSRHPVSGDPAHPNSPARFAPYCEFARVLQPEHGLQDCHQRCTHEQPHCIERICVPEVVAAVKDVLAMKRLSDVVVEASRG